MALPIALQRKLEKFRELIVCPICLYPHTDPQSLPCNHCFCQECVTQALRYSQKCPICKSSSNKRMLRNDMQVTNILKSIEVALSPANRPAKLDDIISTSTHANSNEKTAEPGATTPFTQSRFSKQSVSHGDQDNNTNSTFNKPTMDSQEKKAINPERVCIPRPGSLVEVAKRTWPGINKLGGTGWITQVNDGMHAFGTAKLFSTLQQSLVDNTYNVKYVLGGKEDNIPFEYVEMSSSDLVDANNEATSTATKRRASTRPRTSSPYNFEYLHSNLTNSNDLTSLLFPHDVPKRKKTKGVVPKPSAQKFSFLSTGLKQQQTLKVEDCAKLLNAETHLCWDNSITHVIAVTDSFGRVKTRSIKYLLGVASGKWIVSFQWIEACLKAGKYVDEFNYEVVGDLKSEEHPNGPRRARERREHSLALHGKESLLFDDTVFCFHGSFGGPLPSKFEFVSLARVGGAEVVNDIKTLSERRNPENTISIAYVVVDSNHNAVSNDDLRQQVPESESLPLDIRFRSGHWFLDSIGWHER